MDSTEAQIRELLVKTFHVSERKLAPTSRLFHDLGLDGDDAVEFFDAVEKRFGTDLTTLYRGWREYFGPETPNPWLAAMFGILVAIVTSLAKRVASVIVAFEFALLIGLVTIMVWDGHRLSRRIKPITVGDVVSAVEHGAWPA
jgi:acyl carrier protein